MNIKETFIIRTEWYEAISELSDSDKLVLFDNLFNYHMGNIDLINLNNLTVKLVWKLIEPSLVRNIENYDKRRETSARNGALGGRPKRGDKPNDNLNKPKEPDGLIEKPNNHVSVSVYDSVSVSVSDSDLIEKEKEKPLSLVFPFTSNLFFEKWNLLTSTPKWKNKVPLSLQLALDGFKDYDESFVIEIIEQAIQGEWSVFKGIEVKEMYQRWKKIQKPLRGDGKDKNKRFKPPTVAEVAEYCKNRKNNVDPQKFVDFYQSKGWLVGKVKMKDWQAAVRTWEGNNFGDAKTEKQAISNTVQSSKDYGQLLEKAKQTERDEREFKNKRKGVTTESKEGKPLIDISNIPPELLQEIPEQEITEEELEEVRKHLKNLGNETNANKEDQ